MTIAVTPPDEVIVGKIFVIRNQKVMIDRDLAELYGISTKALKQTVRRNMERFPEDFMFEMNEAEFESWRSAHVISHEDRVGLRYAPFCFTEQGVTMLSCILRSSTAVAVNIRIVRTFTRLREIMLAHKDILLKLEQLERNVEKQDDDIKVIFAYLKELLNPPAAPIRKIGFKQAKE